MDMEPGVYLYMIYLLRLLIVSIIYVYIYIDLYGIFRLRINTVSLIMSIFIYIKTVYSLSTMNTVM